MPTYLDKDGVVHDVDVSTGNIAARCNIAASQHLPPEQERIYPHEKMPVTCFACIAEGPRKGPMPEFIICDTCCAWYQERDEMLRHVTEDEVAEHEEFRVLKNGTLPTCSRCPR